jgi:hypothetical protein
VNHVELPKNGFRFYRNEAAFWSANEHANGTISIEAIEKIYPDAGHKRIIEEKTKKVNKTAIGGSMVPNGGSEELFACIVMTFSYLPRELYWRL